MVRGCVARPRHRNGQVSLADVSPAQRSYADGEDLMSRRRRKITVDTGKS